jgi:predicted branched-subunit amino acid permease
LDSHITIDESTGVAISQENLGKDAMRFGFYATGIGVFVFWNFFTLLGALGANSIGNPATFGLDAAVPAAFLGLIWPRLNTRQARISAIFAVLLALLLVPILPPGFPIIATVLVAMIFGWNKK